MTSIRHRKTKTQSIPCHLDSAIYPDLRYDVQHQLQHLVVLTIESVLVLTQPETYPSKRTSPMVPMVPMVPMPRRSSFIACPFAYPAPAHQTDRPTSIATDRQVRPTCSQTARQESASCPTQSSPVLPDPTPAPAAHPEVYQFLQLIQLLQLFLLPPRLPDLQVQARDISENNHRRAEKHVGAELEEPEGGLAYAELQRHHRPEVEHSQERSGADREGVFVVCLKPVVKCPV